MTTCNLLEYSSNYSDSTGNLWFYSKDEASDFDNDIENIGAFNPFKYKAKLLGDTVAQPEPNPANGVLKMQLLPCQ